MAGVAWRVPRAVVAILVGASLLATPLSAAGQESKDGAKQSPLATLSSRSSDSDASSVVEAAADVDLRLLPFLEVEQLVHRGWWNASTKVVTRSHAARIDFTPAVRRATTEVKRRADLLLRWLDPSFAHPAPTQMAVRWAQNTTAVMIAARFSPKWDGLGGANIAVVSTHKGRAHIDKDRTAEVVQKLLRVSITADRIEADITAEAGNSRKRYQLNFSLFDEVVPLRSPWTVEFLRAQGSMQMSSGAAIAELRISVAKRWPGPRQWPRLTAKTIEEGGAEPIWWSEAPGLTEIETEFLRGSPARTETSFTCAKFGEAFCASTDECVTDCLDHCAKAPTRHSKLSRCIGKPEMGMEMEASFLDEDLEPGTIGGTLSFRHNVSLQDSIERLELTWGISATERLPDFVPIASSEMQGNREISFEVPPGTRVPSMATHLIVIGLNEAGQAPTAFTSLVDRVYPPSPSGLRFEDADPTRRNISGVAEVDRASDEAHIEAYELHFGRIGQDGSVQAIDGTASTLAREDASVPGVPLKLELRGSRKVPPKVTHLVVFSIGAGGVRSKPQAIKLEDASPPTVEPTLLMVGKDLDWRLGYAGFTVKVGRSEQCGPRKEAGEQPGDSGKKCDEGTSVILYFVRSDGTRLGSPLADLPISEFLAGRELMGLEVPAGATHVMALARNVHGEMSRGPMARFLDDKSETISAWSRMRVLASRDDGTTLLWRPFSPDNVSQVLHEDFSSAGVEALALDDHGPNAFAGRSNGQIACLDLGTNLVWDTVEGVSSVTSLVGNGQKMQALRGSGAGILDVWDLKSDTAGKQLVGHTDDITAINVDWVGNRAATSSIDGHVIVWDLVQASEIGRLSGHQAGVSALATSWDKGLFLSGSQDETLRLWSLEGLRHVGTLEGHSEAVRLVFADWEQMRALSVSEDGTVKLWDLKSYECILTFVQADGSQVLAVHVDWKRMQAMAAKEDQIELWDLKEPANNPLSVKSFGRSIKAAAISPAQEDDPSRRPEL